MDAAEKLLVIATAERHIHVVDLAANPGVFAKTVVSPLKFQTKTICAFRDGKGFGVGGIEGRCGISAVEEKDSK